MDCKSSLFYWQFDICNWICPCIYLMVYSLHHNGLSTLQDIPLMTNGPLYPITQDSSCHGQHTMPRNPSQIAKFMGPTWDPPGSCRPQDGPHVGSMNLAIRDDPFPLPVPHKCVLVAVAESVRSGSVAVGGGIYYSDHYWVQAYLKHLNTLHVELAQPVQFYSIWVWLLCFGWYQHWWTMKKILRRPDYQVIYMCISAHDLSKCCLVRT